EDQIDIHQEPLPCRASPSPQTKEPLGEREKMGARFASDRQSASDLCIPTQRIQQVEEVLRRFGVERQRFARDRMRERQVFGVQRLALESAQRLGQHRRRAARQSQATAIQRIADQWPARVRHVHADLVGAAGFQFALQQRVRAEFLANPIMGNGGTPTFAHGAAQAIGRMAIERRIHGAACDRHAVDDGRITTVDVARGQHRDQRGLRGQRARHHQQARSVLVEAMHDAGARKLRQVRVAVQQRVQEGAVTIAGARVHHQARRFVDDPQVGILEHDVELDRLRPVAQHRRLGTIPLHFLATTNQRARRDFPAIQPNAPALHLAGKVRARITPEHSGQDLVETLAGAIGRDFRAQPFSHAGPPAGWAGRIPLSCPIQLAAFAKTCPMPFRRSAPLLKFALFLPLLFAVGACSLFHHGKRDTLNTMTVEQLYQRGHELSQNSNWDAAETVYQKLISRFPYGAYNEQSQIELAYAQYKNDKFEDAYSTINEFIKTYPTQKHIAYAYYLRGLINFDRTETGMQKLAKISPSRFDQGYVLQSFDDFNTLVARFPNTRYAADARQRMIYLRNQLARSELNVAEYYLQRKAYIASADRAKYIVE